MHSVAKRKVKTARLEFIRCATKMFLEQGYSATSPKQIADALDTGTGNLTYYFPTKEHLLAVLVDMLCQFQWHMSEREADEGLSSVMAICLELAVMASICEEDPAARDFYLASYTSPMCLDIIRRNDTVRAKAVFGSGCTGWTEEHFAAAEALVSGIEYAALMPSGEPVSLETRIAGALNAILQIYRIPPEVRREKILRVLEMDYRGIGRRILQEFKCFVERSHEQALEELHRQAKQA